MSRREDIDTGIWTDPDYMSLTVPAKLTYIWTWTNTHCGMAGLYKIARPVGMLETGQTADEFDAALTELADGRFAFYEEGVMFVRSRVKHMRSKTEQIAKSIRGDVAKVAVGHPMREAWMEENASTPWLVKFLGEGWERDGQATLTGVSTEAQAVPALAGISGASVEGQPTLYGNGNGNGPGKGPQGRGAGEGTEGTDFFDIADELGVDRGYVQFCLDKLKFSKQHPTRPLMRSLLKEHVEAPS